jgi:hypothetical protein
VDNDIAGADRLVYTIIIDNRFYTKLIFFPNLDAEGVWITISGPNLDCTPSKGSTKRLLEKSWKK